MEEGAGDMNSGNEQLKIHETEPEPVRINRDHPVIHEDLLPIQSIEGGGPPKKVVFSTLPKPIRYFGYFFVAVLVAMAVMTAVVSLFR